MASLTSHKETPKWDHGLKVPPQEASPNNSVPERRNLRQQTSQEERQRSGVGHAFQITADSKTRSVEGLMVSLTSHVLSLRFYILSVWP